MNTAPCAHDTACLGQNGMSSSMSSKPLDWRAGAAAGACRAAQAEQALALESKFRESLFQALPVPVFLRNDKGEVIKRNKRAKRMEARYATARL